MWSRVLAYQTISDQRAKVFNLLSAWVRDLLFMTNCVNGLCHQHTLLRRFLNKNFTCEERQVYTVYLKVNTVIAIGHDIFVYTVLTKLRSTCWGLTSVDHQAHYFHYTGLKPWHTVQKPCKRRLSN